MLQKMNVRVLLLMFFSITFIFAQKKNAIEIKTNPYSEVIEYFKKKEKEQYDAALFLINNMNIHYSEDNIWLDKKGDKINFNVYNYTDIEAATSEFKKLSENLGLHARAINIKDSDAVTSKLLIENTELAYKAWKEGNWSKNYDFKTFCEYILPYRSLTEPLQNWRSEYYSIFEKLAIGLQDPQDPVELASKIVSNIKHFDFVLKRFDTKPLLGPNDLLFWRQGNCPDLANVAIFASRSLGIAVTFDYTPHYAASSNRHYWNTVIDNKGNHIPFNGNQDLPYIYNAVSKRLGKVFRVTFSKQQGSLPSLIPENQIPDDFLKSSNILDVTSEYVTVSDLNYSFTSSPLTKVCYINVFNKGGWRVLDWAKITDKNAIFKNMGRDIVYLPSTYVSDKMIFENYPILLDQNGKKTVLKPDMLNSFPVILSRDNEYKTKYTDNNPFQILEGEKYRIYVWSGNWRLIEEVTAVKDNFISFKKIPKNGLFLMCSAKPDFYERIFTIQPDTNMITWY